MKIVVGKPRIIEPLDLLSDDVEKCNGLPETEHKRERDRLIAKLKRRLRFPPAAAPSSPW